MLDPRIGESHTFVDREKPYWDSHCLNKDVPAIAEEGEADFLKEVIRFNEDTKSAMRSIEKAAGSKKMLEEFHREIGRWRREALKMQKEGQAEGSQNTAETDTGTIRSWEQRFPGTVSGKMPKSLGNSQFY